jgi:succinate dehydrogenase hydrophobic anchor subunit
MGAYVLLTVYLRQKGSAESKKLQGEEDNDREPQKTDNTDAPGPVRRGGWMLKLYENSLSIAFVLLFLLSFGLHAAGGSRAACEDNTFHGEACTSTVGFMGTSEFWYQSLQNWQSEFLAVFAIVVLSIFLRQKGSPESKPVNSPHAQTGA